MNLPKSTGNTKEAVAPSDMTEKCLLGRLAKSKRNEKRETSTFNTFFKISCLHFVQFKTGFY